MKLCMICNLVIVIGMNAAGYSIKDDTADLGYSGIAASIPVSAPGS